MEVSSNEFKQIWLETFCEHQKSEDGAFEAGLKTLIGTRLASLDNVYLPAPNAEGFLGPLPVKLHITAANMVDNFCIMFGTTPRQP